jgi:hypothetical protein
LATTFTSIGQAARKINTAVKSGSRKALNEAVKETNKMVLKELKAETGFANTFLKQRIWMYTATAKIPTASIKIAIKHGIHLGDPVMKPKEKKIRVSVAGHSRKTPKGQATIKGHKRTYFGVTAQLGPKGRTLINDGFYRILSVGKANRKLKEIVLARKGEKPYPTVALKTDLFQQSAKRIQKPASDLLNRLFSKNMNAYINDAITKTVSATTDT